MSIEKVTYYRLSCDTPDCKIDTASLGDYSAWSDRDAAVEQWEDWSGVVLEDGSAYCQVHAQDKACIDCDYTGTNLVRGEDGEHRCLVCAAAAGVTA